MGIERRALLWVYYSGVLIVGLIRFHPLHRDSHEIGELLNLILLPLQDLPIIDFGPNALNVDEDLFGLSTSYNHWHCSRPS